MIELLTLQDLNEATGLSKSGLAYWQKIGLLIPTARTKGQGILLFEDRHIKLVQIVQDLKKQGMSLKEVAKELQNGGFKN